MGAIGKNKRLSKGKKRNKKVVDKFANKDWYSVYAPALFTNKLIGQTIVNKTKGQTTSAMRLANRVYSCSVADLTKDEENSYRNMSFKTHAIEGKSVFTDVKGCRLTRDRQMSMIRKLHTIIHNHVHVTTTDGYRLRLFTFTMTARRDNQVKKTCYTTSSQDRLLRSKFTSVLKAECEKLTMREVINKLTNETLGQLVERASRRIFPLMNCYILKMKVLSAPEASNSSIIAGHMTYDDTSVEKNLLKD